jgi:hypothetical protein
MKSAMTNWMFSMLLLLPFAGFAQYDDLYYDPADDTDYTSYVYEEAPAAKESRPYAETLPSYSQEYDDYSYWDEQDYVYSSRIRRFHQPYGNFGYYDPIYTDMGFYDPWMMPGSSIYIVGGGFNDYRHWRRMNRFRSFGPFGFNNSFSPWAYRGFMDPWSFNSWGAYRVYDPWFDPYWGGACFNRGFGGGFGPGWGGGFGNTYFINNYYGGSGMFNNPGYWYGNPNGTIDNTPSNTHYGPRSTGARTAPARTASSTELRGSGIPTIRQVEGTTRPVNPAGIPQEDGKSIRNGQVPVERGKDLNNAITPERPTTQPERGTTNPTAPVREQDNTTPTRNQRDEINSNTPRGTVSPATPERKDPLGDRPRWNDTESNPRQQATPQSEMGRDAYRDNYIRNRQSEPERRITPPSRERTTPGQDRQNPSDRFNTPSRSNPSQERTSPIRPRTAPSDNQRTAPSRERTSPNPGRDDFRSSSPSRGGSSPSYDAPSRSSSPSGGSTRSSNNSSRSSSPSRGGRGG